MIRRAFSTTPPLPSKSEILSLYKQMLRACVTYPSMKKEVIGQEIKDGFRENMLETSPLKILHEFDSAKRVLNEFNRYRNYSDSGEVSVRAYDMQDPEKK